MKVFVDKYKIYACIIFKKALTLNLYKHDKTIVSYNIFILKISRWKLNYKNCKNFDFIAKIKIAIFQTSCDLWFLVYKKCFAYIKNNNKIKAHYIFFALVVVILLWFTKSNITKKVLQFFRYIFDLHNNKSKSKYSLFQ